MKIYFLTLFPEEMGHFFLKGIFARANKRGLFEVNFIQLRDFANNKHNKIDDTPFGGNQGMIIRADVLYRAIKSIENYQDYRILYACPKGQIWNQARAESLQKERGLIIISGYYEGIDDRIFDLLTIERISLGNFILSSGDLPALIIAESILRLVPGVIGNQLSISDDSITSGLLEYSQYTQPRNFLGYHVPEVLLSGHHQKIKEWQTKEALSQTFYKKPELLINYNATNQEQQLLVETLKEETKCQIR